MENPYDQQPQLNDRPSLNGKSAEELARGAFEQQWQETVFRVLSEELSEIQYAETELAKIWPQMAVAASDQILHAVLYMFAEQSKRRLVRIGLAGRLLGINPQSMGCLTMDSLLLGVCETIHENHAGAGRDVGLLNCSQKIIRYLVTTYCCTRDFAQLLGMDYAVQILQRTIDEESAMELRLANLADLLYPDAAGRLFV